jgi:signal transduction histidine kinase
LALDESSLSHREKVELFFAVQEGLTNVFKHSGASRARVRLFPSGKDWRLEIEDDGSGFAPDDLNKPGRIGLTILRERAGELGATFSLEREQGVTRLIMEKGEYKQV